MEAFLEFGFEGASMDEIVRRAGVSKGTVYNYFSDKEALFCAVMLREFENRAGEMLEDAEQANGIEPILTAIARRYLTMILSPETQAIFRVMVAEAPRFPEIGREFYASGPNRVIKRLKTALDQACKAGELTIADTETAAHQFVELCRADLFYKIILCVETKPTKRRIDKIVNSAVGTFMAAFSNR